MQSRRLSEEDFADGLSMYEALMRRRTGEQNQDAAHRASLRRVESTFEGFSEDYLAYEEDQRTEVQRIDIVNVIRRDTGAPSWYSGAKTEMGEWPEYRERIKKGLPDAAIDAIHGSTERILSQCANPMSPGDRRKGLVIGYVQSGKTANFTGLIAKAVDSGYRIIIVLAGMYTNLRIQTQLRLQKDLGTETAKDGAGISWIPLTRPDADIGKGLSSAYLGHNASTAVIITKKHETRLKNVADYLDSIEPSLLKKRGVMIIDDESDQATPNTLGEKDGISTVNQRIRDLWKAVPTGTYVAYTATPFANIFIDPSAKDDLYPDDFITALPEPTGYMGSELFFDVAQNADDDPDEAIHQLAREVPKDDAEIFRPPLKKIDDFAPEVTPSLEDAIRWFLIATAVRELRAGERQHSSMLLHTSQYIAVHSLTKDVVMDFLRRLNFDGEDEKPAFRALFDVEKDRASLLRGSGRMPGWEEIWDKTKTVLERVVVKIDNGKSDDRLVYKAEDPQTVIAIGGGTLSRGLTLEGLVVSYFLRSSNTYDTLLQMGRWFGFRPGYADLVRVWMGPGLLDDYAHLARVERQLRDEVKVMERERRTPQEFAVKVRSHPGRLEITSRGKMSAAMLVHAGLGGTRRQTIYLDRSRPTLQKSREAASALVRRALEHGGQPMAAPSGSTKESPTLVIPGLREPDLSEFLRGYWVSATDRWLQPDVFSDWVKRHAPEATWNLVLVSGGGNAEHEYSDGISVSTSRRAPVDSDHWKPSKLGVDLPEESDVVNIRALMSGDDHLIDLRTLAANDMISNECREIIDRFDSGDEGEPVRRTYAEARAMRSVIRPDEGAVLLYAIDGDSQPDPKSKTRTAMNADGAVIGFGIVFPHVVAEDRHEYWAVELPERNDEEGVFDPAGYDGEADTSNQDLP